MRHSDLFFIIWKDNKLIQLITNVYEPKNIDFVDRDNYITNDSETLQIPYSIIKYTQFMGGVDLSDQFCSYIETERKTKWWKKLFFHILDVCIINSWIIYKKYGNDIKLQNFKFQL